MENEESLVKRRLFDDYFNDERFNNTLLLDVSSKIIYQRYKQKSNKSWGK